MEERDSLISILPSLKSDEEKLTTMVKIVQFAITIDEFYEWKEKAWPLIEKTGNKEAKLEFMIVEGRVHLNNQQDEKGMLLTQEALKEAEEQQDSTRISRINYSMGVYYFWKEELDYAFKYILRSVETFPSDGNQVKKAVNLMALGVILQGQEKYEEALMYHQQSLEIKEAEGAWSQIPISLNNLSELHFEIGNTDKAIELADRAIVIADSTGVDPAYYYAKFIKGQYYTRTGDPERAIPLVEEAVKYWEDIDSPKDLPRAYSVLTETYKAAGKHDLAFFSLEKYVAIKDSLFKGDQQVAAKDIAAKYETEKKELLLEQEKKESQLIKTQERQRLIIFSVIGVLLLLNVLWFYRRYKNQRKDKEIIEEQKIQIEERSQEIIDSIVYAKRIQSAILPTDRRLSKLLPKSFVLYKPKDVVAGDFYWLEEVHDNVLFAAADCTGHGVPGAMVSVVCNNGLNAAVRQFGLTDPAEILDKTKEIVVEEFEKAEEDVKDGMDIALCCLHKPTRTLRFAGAHNPLWLIRDGELTEIKGSKQPIGKSDSKDLFTSHKMDVLKNDLIYVFTDGFADQFGGDKGKKLKAANFKKLLLSVADLSMPEQLQKIDDAFENWKGELEQLDDVCVIGVRI